MSFFSFDFICSPAGFKVSAEILEGLFISWWVWTTMAMRASGNIPKKDNTMWRMALHRQQSVRNNKKEDESVGSKSSRASAESDEKTWPISRYVCWPQMKHPPCFWSRILHTHALKDYSCCIVLWNPVSVSLFLRISILSESSKLTFMLGLSPCTSRVKDCFSTWLFASSCTFEDLISRMLLSFGI